MPIDERKNTPSPPDPYSIEDYRVANRIQAETIREQAAEIRKLRTDYQAMKAALGICRFEHRRARDEVKQLEELLRRG